MQPRGQRQDRQQHDGQRRRRGGIPEAEPGFVDVIQQQRRGVVGSAARHHHDVVDHPERVDHRVDQHEQRGRHQQRQRDAAEIVPARGAFQRRRLAQIRRHGLQRGEIEDHEEPGFLPHRDGDHRRQRGGGVAQPVVPAAAEPAKDAVEQSVIRRVEEHPDIGDRDHRQHGRQEIRHAQQGAARQRAVHRQRHEQRQHDRGRNRGGGIDRVVAQRLPEHRVVEQVGIVVEADERRGPAAVRRGVQAVDQRLDRRPMGERHQQHQRGQQQQIGVDGFAAHGARPMHDDGLESGAACTASGCGRPPPAHPPSPCAGVLLPLRHAWMLSVSTL